MKSMPPLSKARNLFATYEFWGHEFCEFWGQVSHFPLLDTKAVGNGRPDPVVRALCAFPVARESGGKWET
jgi:hypothetical protein